MMKTVNWLLFFMGLSAILGVVALLEAICLTGGC